VLLQLVRDITNGVCQQHDEKRLKQQKGRSNVNVCAAEEILEEELSVLEEPFPKWDGTSARQKS